ncbi:hypothetical protein Pmar_PMAR009338, partial [Perkinsus marinus ATCC 50983]
MEDNLVENLLALPGLSSADHLPLVLASELEVVLSSQVEFPIATKAQYRALHDNACMHATAPCPFSPFYLVYDLRRSLYL